MIEARNNVIPPRRYHHVVLVMKDLDTLSSGTSTLFRYDFGMDRLDFGPIFNGTLLVFFCIYIFWIRILGS